MVILDVVSLLIPTFLLFSWLGKLVLDSYWQKFLATPEHLVARRWNGLRAQYSCKNLKAQSHADFQVNKKKMGEHD